MIKASVILKNVNENCVYAIDCESEENVFFKFEGVSKFFIEEMHAGKSEQEVIDSAVKKFSGVDKKQVQNDFQDFLITIKDFALTES